MLALTLLSILAVATAWAQVTPLTAPWEGPVETEDAALAAPQILGVRFYLNAAGEVTDLQFEFSLVPNATYYRLWREIELTHGLDERGNLVPLAEPASQFVPWARVPADAIASTDKGTVLVSPLDVVLTDWAISAAVERDGALYRSPLRYFALPTAVASASWGQLKHRQLRNP